MIDRMIARVIKDPLINNLEMKMNKVRGLVRTSYPTIELTNYGDGEN